MRDARSGEYGDVAPDEREGCRGGDFARRGISLEKRLQIQFAKCHLRSEAVWRAHFRGKCAEDAEAAGVQDHRERRARRKRRMVFWLELQLSGVQPAHKLLDSAFHPQNRFFFRDGGPAVERLAADWPHETEREPLRLAGASVEHFADFEEHSAINLVRRIPAEAGHQLRQERRPHHAEVRRNGVRNHETLLFVAHVETVEFLLRKEGIVHRFGESEGGAEVTEAGTSLEMVVRQRRDRRCAGHLVRNVVQSVDAGDFLD